MAPVASRRVVSGNVALHAFTASQSTVFTHSGAERTYTLVLTGIGPGQNGNHRSDPALAARRPSIAPTPIHEAVFANLRGRGQPVRAQVDLTDANEERKDSDRQKKSPVR
jgi:hypothetical protein